MSELFSYKSKKNIIKKVFFKLTNISSINVFLKDTSNYFKHINGAGKGDRTLDLLVGNETLYH